MSAAFHKRFADREAAVLKAEIDADVDDKVNDLQEKIDELESRVEALE